MRAFPDSNGDGIGDFAGLTQQLDYLADLGVTAIWLLPFYPSPLRDDGYDIADYLASTPHYGTLRRLRGVPRRGAPARHPGDHRAGDEPHLRPAPVVPAVAGAARQPPSATATCGATPTTSTPTRASSSSTSRRRTGPGTRWRGQYYWHRFYCHQPDLNFDNPEVARRDARRRSTSGSTSGVDGLRLDAVPYLFEREGTNCENLPETHEFLKRAAQRPRRTSTRTACCSPRPTSGPRTPSTYFGDGDECHMAFHFPLMPRLFMALRLEDRSRSSTS